ncbi:MAG: DUF2235 domain-containing protein [Pseudomonadota bacterium]
MSKKLIVLFDGTWKSTNSKTLNPLDGGNQPVTNVVRFLEALKPTDNHKNVQLAHYVPGIGTRKLERILGGAFGYGISNAIKEAYLFIATNYEPDDEIYLLGFSRGAYSARSLAGMIHNVGILQRRFLYLLDDAYDYYKSRDKAWHPDAENSINFRKQFTWGDDYKKIHFIGVWDTVAALGSPYGLLFSKLVDHLFNRHFHDTKLSPSVLNAYQAVAIDEKRWPYRPVLWDHQYEKTSSRIEELWFPGDHVCVGGSGKSTGLSDIALEWMIRKAKEHGLKIDTQLISDPIFSPDFLEPIPERGFSKWFYRIATLCSVKFLSIYYVNDEDRPLVDHIGWNGDYLRPIRDTKAISPEAKIRMEMDESYRPHNYVDKTDTFNK